MAGVEAESVACVFGKEDVSSDSDSKKSAASESSCTSEALSASDSGHINKMDCSMPDSVTQESNGCKENKELINSDSEKSDTMQHDVQKDKGIGQEGSVAAAAAADNVNVGAEKEEAESKAEQNGNPEDGSKKEDCAGADACSSFSSATVPSKPRRQRIRKKKSGDGPKRPLSAYTLFLVEVRSKVSKENADLEFKQVAQRVGQMWKDLSEERKSVYQEKAKEDKARYIKEMVEWKKQERLAPPPPEADSMLGKRRRKVKGSPKNPLSAYTYFLVEMRNRAKEMSMKKEKEGEASEGDKDKAAAVDDAGDKGDFDIKEKGLRQDMGFRSMAVRIGEMWRELSDQEKSKYVAKAVTDRARYDEELKVWKAEQAEVAAKAAAAAPALGGAVKLLQPPKNALTAYTFFLMAARPKIKENNPELTSQQLVARIGAAWKELNLEGRKEYMVKAEMDKVRYRRQKEEFIKASDEAMRASEAQRVLEAKKARDAAMAKAKASARNTKKQKLAGKKAVAEAKGGNNDDKAELCGIGNISSSHNLPNCRRSKVGKKTKRGENSSPLKQSQQLHAQQRLQVQQQHAEQAQMQQQQQQMQAQQQQMQQQHAQQQQQYRMGLGDAGPSRTGGGGNPNGNNNAALANAVQRFTPHEQMQHMQHIQQLQNQYQQQHSQLTPQQHQQLMAQQHHMMLQQQMYMGCHPIGTMGATAVQHQQPHQQLPPPHQHQPHQPQQQHMQHQGSPTPPPPQHQHQPPQGNYNGGNGVPTGGTPHFGSQQPQSIQHLAAVGVQPMGVQTVHPSQMSQFQHMQQQMGQQARQHVGNGNGVQSNNGAPNAVAYKQHMMQQQLAGQNQLGHIDAFFQQQH